VIFPIELAFAKNSEGLIRASWGIARISCGIGVKVDIIIKNEQNAITTRDPRFKSGNLFINLVFLIFLQKRLNPYLNYKIIIPTKLVYN